MKKFLLAFIAGMMVVAAGAADLNWFSDLNQAKKAAAQEKKPILMLFTGSDWCQFCIKQHKELLDTKAFQDFANKNVVLMLVDYPRKKAQSGETKMANKILYSTYRCEGFPQLMLINANGNLLKKFTAGYNAGTAPALLQSLEKAVQENADK